MKTRPHQTNNDMHDEVHKVSLRIFQICTVNNDLLLHLASFDASLIVFGDIFSILQVWPLSWLLKKLDLRWMKAEFVMLMSAPECEKQSKNSMVSTNDCGLASSNSPFPQSISTSSLVSGSACLHLEPSPAACRCFISASIDALKSANSGPLKMSKAGLPFVQRCLIIPQQMWWSVFRGKILPSS